MNFLFSSFRRYAFFLVVVLLLPATVQAGRPNMFRNSAPLAGPCVAGPTTLCLNDQRFKVEVRWKDFQGNTGTGKAVPLTSDTGYFWFFSSNNVELVVKVLDGRVLNSHFWVFYGALSNVEYTMDVTDSVTGRVKTYFNPSGQFASVGDTQAFAASDTPALASQSTPSEGSMSADSFDAAEIDAPQVMGTCFESETNLCLSGGRFRVEVSWKDFQGNTGVGKAVSLTSDTGYFWFFNSANVELVVKVLDARVLNDRFWVFYGALSNVEYEMTVVDTSNGEVRKYLNPAHRFASAGDTAAFPREESAAIRLARQLADQVSLARTPQERQQAILQILEALNVGVYTSSGQPVLRGAERGPGDFYLYDLQVQMMSQALERGDNWGIADLTTFVNEMGILSLEDKLQPDDLRQILLGGTRSAMADPEDPTSLAALINREMGLRRPAPYDAAVDIHADSARFDALQHFLILADLTLPIVWESGPVRVQSNLVSQFGGVLKQGPIVPQVDCDDIGKEAKDAWKVSKLYLMLNKVRRGIKSITSGVIDGIHGSIVAYGVEVRALDDRLETHYGHESPGRELHFRLFVNMRDELPEWVIKCGWLAGVEFPKKGPIEGVTVVWLAGGLDKHGDLSCGAGCTTKTGPDGVATLIFKPKTEEEPGEGSVIEETGLVDGVALYLTKLKNTLGNVAQVLTPKSGTTRWLVEYHSERVTFEHNIRPVDENCYQCSIDITVLFVPRGARVTANTSWGTTASATGDSESGIVKLPLALPRHCPCLPGSFTVSIDGQQVFSNSSDCY